MHKVLRSLNLKLITYNNFFKGRLTLLHRNFLKMDSLSSHIFLNYNFIL